MGFFGAGGMLLSHYFSFKSYSVIVIGNNYGHLIVLVGGIKQFIGKLLCNSVALYNYGHIHWNLYVDSTTSSKLNMKYTTIYINLNLFMVCW